MTPVVKPIKKVLKPVIKSAPTILEAAQAYRAAGLSPLPTGCGSENKDKRPCGVAEWGPYQKRAADAATVERWFTSPNRGVALIGGAVSGNLVIIGFDMQGEVFEPWVEAVRQAKPGLFEKLTVEITPSGGRHVFLRCPQGTIPRSEKLASRPTSDGGQVLIETRGEAGYARVYPTPGYRLIQGRLDKISEVTPTEMDLLCSIARSFDECPESKPIVGREQRSKWPGELLPGEDFDARGRDIESMVQEHEWVLVEERKGRKYLRRPGKNKGTCSASITADKVLFVFSSNAAPFGSFKSYSAFGVYTVLYHAGDFNASAKALAREGFGRKCEIRNYKSVLDAKKNRVKEALPLTEITKVLFELTGGWPKRAGGRLFIRDGAAIRYFDNESDLFSYLNTIGKVFWTPGTQTKTGTTITKHEFFLHLLSVAEKFDAVESIPRQPAITNHYSLWSAPADYVPDGHHFDALLKCFQNVETPEDLDLIRAFFMVIFWGGECGTRPIFGFTADDVGCGKTTMVRAAAELCGGGVIEIDFTAQNQERTIPRILSNGSSQKHIILFDNIRVPFSSPIIENMVTCSKINGHKLYEGDAERPNTLTITATGNDLELSRDMADRSFLIKLKKPKMCPEWHESTFAYIKQNRAFIIADILAALNTQPARLTLTDRWMSFAANVLARASKDPDAVLKLNQQRRDAGDSEITQARVIEEAFASKVHIVKQGEWGFVPSDTANLVVREALNQLRMTTTATTRLLKKHIKAGRLKCLRHKETSKCNGFEYYKPKAP
jgi:hypothetical protein